MNVASANVVECYKTGNICVLHVFQKEIEK